MRPIAPTPPLRLLLAVVLIAAQAVAFAHDVDESAHPAQTVCDLCVAGHALGSAAAGGEVQCSLQRSGASHGLPSAVVQPTGPSHQPRQRAPPVSC